MRERPATFDPTHPRYHRYEQYLVLSERVRATLGLSDSVFWTLICSPCSDCNSRGMILYNSAVSGNCYKVRLLFAHLGIAYEVREVDVVDRSTRPDILGGLNPALRVPTLVLDDGRPLAESGAILWYAGEGSRFVPDDRYTRAQALQWMFFEQYETEPTLAVARFLIGYSQLPREEYEKRLPRLWEGGNKGLAVMDKHLADRDVVRR